MRWWTLTEPDAKTANDFYPTRQQAEAALADARARDTHPEDAEVLAQLTVAWVDLEASRSPN